MKGVIVKALNAVKYSEIVAYPREWDRKAFPFVAHIEVPSETFDQLEARIRDQTQTVVLGHDEADHGYIVVHIGCTTEAVRERIESRWG